MNIGLIGLGHMGSAIATSLVRAGHDLIAFNRSPEKFRALAVLGVRRAAHIADACKADVLITSLADDAAVEQVVLAADGVVTRLRKGAIHLSMSTISVALSERLALAHARAGQRYVAAPVFGRPDAALAAKLFIVAAGDPAAVSACMPIFAVLAQKTVPIGAEPVAANLVKLSGNFLLAAAIEALGEAIALVGKAGIDRNVFVDLLTTTIFPAPAYKLHGDLVANSKFLPARFSVHLGQKDINLALAAAATLRVPMPLADLLRDRFLRVVEWGGDSLDWSALGGLATQDAADTR